MTKQPFKKVILMFLFGLFFFCGIKEVFAENLPPGMVIGDTEGIQVDSSGDYYIQKEDLLPGDKFTKKIKLMNTEKTDVPYVLELDIAPTGKEGAIDFYTAITMIVRQDDEVVYNGNLVGKGQPDIQNSRLNLGKYAYGEFSELEVEFQVADDLPTEDWQTESHATVKWTFYATKERPIKPNKPVNPGEEPPNSIKRFLPQTGEEWKNLLYRILVGVFVICVVLIVKKKSKLSSDR